MAAKRLFTATLLTCCAHALNIELPQLTKRRCVSDKKTAAPATAPLAALLLAAAPALPAHADSLPIIGNLLDTEEGKQLGVYFAQTLISWGVPGAVLILLAIISAGKGEPPDDLDQLPPPLAKALGLSKEPKEYLKIERLNAKLSSFDYSLAKATVSKESALRAAERIALERRFGAEIAAFGLDSEAVRAIGKAEERFRKADRRLSAQLEKKTRALRANALGKANGGGGAAEDADESDGHESDGANDGFLASVALPGWLPKLGLGGEPTTDDSSEPGASSVGSNASASAGGGGPMSGMASMLSARAAKSQIAKLQEAKLQNELAFLAALSRVLTPEQASQVAAIFKPAASDAKGPSGPGAGPGAAGGAAEGAVGSGGASAVGLLAERAADSRTAAKHVFVLKFFGDVTASQVSTLRQEVRARAGRIFAQRCIYYICCRCVCASARLIVRSCGEMVVVFVVVMMTCAGR